MADIRDLEMRRMEMAWELAGRIIPVEPQNSGAWMEDNYLSKAQQTLKEAKEVIDAVFAASGEKTARVANVQYN